MAVIIGLFMLGSILQPGSADAAGLIAPKSVCKNQNRKAGSNKARSSMVCMTNYARHRSGLRRYRHNRALDRSATRKANDILRCDSFSHEACHRDFTYWIRRVGYIKSRCWSAAENIAWGGGRLGTVRSIFIAWMKSPGHRGAILDKSFTQFGVGDKRGRFKRYRGSSVWVQHFGYRGCG